MIIFCIIIVVLFIIGWILYNQLVRERNQIDNAFSTVDVILKKRYDLIPNLVETVKGYSKHEQTIYENIASLRNKAIQASDKDEVVKLDREISNGISEIKLLAEDYPELQASENYLKLQKTLETVENELSAARRTYNAAVTEFNISIEAFPTNIIASMFKMKRRELFVVEENVRSNIKVNL